MVLESQSIKHQATGRSWRVGLRTFFTTLQGWFNTTWKLLQIGFLTVIYSFDILSMAHGRFFTECHVQCGLYIIFKVPFAIIIELSNIFVMTVEFMWLTN